jgi:hypothetical protein
VTGSAFNCGTTQERRYLLTSDLPTCCDEVPAMLSAGCRADGLSRSSGRGSNAALVPRPRLPLSPWLLASALRRISPIFGTMNLKLLRRVGFVPRIRGKGGRSTR